ncbi:MAG: iron hydrogenase small subunit [Thermoguttaceae bacterium]|nr:iron hydrogenase small subunit [Thermoguttaceae bacterium]
MKRNEENDGAKRSEMSETTLEALEGGANARISRRQALKTGTLGLASATLGGGSVFAQGGGRGRGRGRGFQSALDNDAPNAAANGSADDEFPYHLDGCKTFSEYKALRKREKRACDPVVVEPDNPSLTYERRRCANCGRCDEACMAQTISHWYRRDTLKDGVSTICVNCGQCVTACKFNVLHERLDYVEVASAIRETALAAQNEATRKTGENEENGENGKAARTFVATTAPALRVSLGEMFGLEPGANLEAKLAAALRLIGFDFVFDATFGADLTIEEESRELWARLNEPNAGPLFTSCCPAWVKFVETFYPEFIPNLSTTRSPLLSQGAAIKTRFAEEKGLDPATITHVAFVPCVGKKFEATLPNANAAGRYWKNEKIRDLDFALTTRELASWLMQTNVDPATLDDEPFDSTLGNGSGAGKIFGATGGVAEAALRNLWKVVEGTDPPAELLKFEPLRGTKALKTATVEIGGKTVRVAVASGLAAVRPLLETLKTTGKIEFDFVEVMACPGGCVGGGGQPKIGGMRRPNDAWRQQRADGLFEGDAKVALRTSGDNPEIQAFYRDFVGEPLGERAKSLFHTTFEKRDVWK